MDLLNKESFKPKGVLLPEDQSITSLYVSHLTLDIKESDIRAMFSRFGQIESIKMMDHHQSCFVNF